MSEKVILFGASTLGKVALEFLQRTDMGYEIIAFCDNDNRKWGTEFCGVPVISPDQLAGYDCQIIITSQYDTEIIKQLFGLGIFRFSVFFHNQGQEMGEKERYQIRKYDYNGVDLNRVNNRIVLRSVSNSGSNTFALYKLMPVDMCEQYEVELVSDQERDEQYYYYLITSKAVILTYPSAIDPSQINIQLWHGFPLKGMSYMSKSGDPGVEQNHLNWSKLDVIASYSQFYTTLMNACYGVSWRKYVVTGMPRNDFLFKADGRKILASILKQDFRGKKILFYMPTFRSIPVLKSNEL